MSSINVSNIKRKFVGNAENQTRGCWVRSKYATSVLYNPLHLTEVQHQAITSCQFCQKNEQNTEERNLGCFWENPFLEPIRFFLYRKLIGKLFKKSFLAFFCFSNENKFWKIAFSFIDEINLIGFSDQSFLVSFEASVRFFCENDVIKNTSSWNDCRV